MGWPVVNPYLLLSNRSVAIARAKPVATRAAHVIMTASNPKLRYRGVRASGEKAYPANLALLNTEDDVPLSNGYARTTIVRRDAHMKLDPTPVIDMRARNSRYSSAY